MYTSWPNDCMVGSILHITIQFMSVCRTQTQRMLGMVVCLTVSAETWWHETWLASKCILSLVHVQGKYAYPPSTISSIASRMRSRFSRTVFFSTAPLINEIKISSSRTDSARDSSVAHQIPASLTWRFVVECSTLLCNYDTEWPPLAEALRGRHASLRDLIGIHLDLASRQQADVCSKQLMKLLEPCISNFARYNTPEQ